MPPFIGTPFNIPLEPSSLPASQARCWRCSSIGSQNLAPLRCCSDGGSLTEFRLSTVAYRSILREWWGLLCTYIVIYEVCVCDYKVSHGITAIGDSRDLSNSSWGFPMCQDGMDDHTWPYDMYRISFVHGTLVPTCSKVEGHINGLGRSNCLVSVACV